MDIVQGCRLNNRKAQTLLFNELHTIFINHAKRYLNHDNIETIHDIVQDSFITIFRDFNKFKGTTVKDVRNWGCVIVKNKIIDLHRSIKSKPTIEIYDSILENIEEDSIYEKYFQYIDKGIEKLTPAYKNVFTLYYKDNFKHQEIAEQLGISISASKSNLMRAKTSMKKYLIKLKLEE